jgi:8-oxo-dGTP diphosphatase
MKAEWRSVGVYVVCRDHHERILLTRLNVPGLPGHGAWTLPGGGMEWGEQSAETAVRELDEETGYRAVLGPVIGIWSEWLEAHESPRNKPGHGVGILYEGRIVSGDLRTSFPAGSTDQAAWFRLQEVAALETVALVDFALDLLTYQSE